MTVRFDTLQVTSRLEDVGFSVEPARTFVSVMAETAGTAELVTKADLAQRLQVLEQRMTIRLGGMLVVMTGVLAALLRFTH